MKAVTLTSLALLTVACNAIPLGNPKYRTTVQGTLKDPSTAQATHDAFVATVQSTLPSHLTFAGALDPTTAQVDGTQFISVDTWEDESAMDRYYADAKTTAGFDSFLQSGYTVLMWQHPADFAEWGSINLQETSLNPVFLFRIRGRYKNPSLDETRTTHNRVAGGDSEATAQSLSDVAHAVNVGLSDTQEALFLDLWQNPQGAGQFFSSDATINGGAEVFEAPGPQPIIFVPAAWARW